MTSVLHTALAILFLPSAFADDLPNIIFIVADDMGFDAVSVNNPEIGSLINPNIDKLSKEGRPS